MKKLNLKIIIPIVVVIIAIIGILIFTSNHKEKTVELQADNDTYKIGETIQDDNFAITLKSVEFGNYIDMNTIAHPDPVFKQYKIGTGNFFLPADKENGSITAGEGKTFLFYTLEYKFIGKDPYTAYSSFGTPNVTYDNEYIFNEDYVSARNKGDGWTILCIDYNKIQIPGILSSSSNYQPLDDTNYLVRGVIRVPEKLKNDTEKTLTIQFSNLGKGIYKIR